MIVWSGHGWVVAVVSFGSLIATEAAVEAAFHDDRYYQTHGWPKLVGFCLGALFVTAASFVLESRGKRRLIDPETNEEVFIGGNDTLFFIPIRWWGPLLVLLGIAFGFVRE